MMRTIRIMHRPSGQVIAEGPVGFRGITPFEGNLYIRPKYLKTDCLRPNWVPGFYKFLYVGLDLQLSSGSKERFLGWMYWLPNPLFPFIAFRPAVPRSSPVLKVDEIVNE
jgi:hypothetical protein